MNWSKIHVFFKYNLHMDFLVVSAAAPPSQQPGYPPPQGPGVPQPVAMPQPEIPPNAELQSKAPPAYQAVVSGEKF